MSVCTLQSFITPELRHTLFLERPAKMPFKVLAFFFSTPIQLKFEDGAGAMFGSTIQYGA
jgi:hypothetical protein